MPAVNLQWTAVHRSGGGAVVATVGAGHLWVAYAHGATPPASEGDQTAANSGGELVGYDPTTGRADITATIGAFPSAIAASSSGVWVANGVGDGYAVKPALVDTVEQFTAAGKLVATTHVEDPLALTASGAQAWVYYSSGQQQPRVRLLTAPPPGESSTVQPSPDEVLPGQLASAADPLTYCGGEVFAVSAESATSTVSLTQIAATSGTIATVDADFSHPSLICPATGKPLLLLPGLPTVLLSAATGYTALQLSAGPAALARAGGGHVWLIDNNLGTVSVTDINDAGQARSETLTMPSRTTPVFTADQSGLWILVPTIDTNSTTLQASHVALP